MKEYFGTIEINFDAEEGDALWDIAQAVQALQLEGITVNWTRTGRAECQEEDE